MITGPIKPCERFLGTSRWFFSSDNSEEAAWHKKRNFGDGADNSSFAYLKGIGV